MVDFGLIFLECFCLDKTMQYMKKQYMKPRSIIAGQKNTKKATLVVYFHPKHVNNMLHMSNNSTYTYTC